MLMLCHFFMTRNELKKIVNKEREGEGKKTLGFGNSQGREKLKKQSNIKNADGERDKTMQTMHNEMG